MAMQVESPSSLLTRGSFILWHLCLKTAKVAPLSMCWTYCSKGRGGVLRGLFWSVSSLSGTAGRWLMLRVSESAGNTPVRDLVRGLLWNGDRVPFCCCCCCCYWAFCSACGATGDDAVGSGILILLGWETSFHEMGRKNKHRNKERSDSLRRKLARGGRPTIPMAHRRHKYADGECVFWAVVAPAVCN